MKSIFYQKQISETIKHKHKELTKKVVYKILQRFSGISCIFEFLNFCKS